MAGRRLGGFVRHSVRTRSAAHAAGPPVAGIAQEKAGQAAGFAGTPGGERNRSQPVRLRYEESIGIAHAKDDGDDVVNEAWP
jgi:hypothetical protein